MGNSGFSRRIGGPQRTLVLTQGGSGRPDVQKPRRFIFLCKGFFIAIGRLPTAIPVAGKANLTSGFGPRLDPFTGRYGFHSGVDFAGAPGTPVLATAGGQVVFAGRGGSYGNMVLVDHGFGLRTRYAHLMSIAVAIGQGVLKGTPVGRLGSTGRSPGPHVHYEILYYNLARNPANFFCIVKASCR